VCIAMGHPGAYLEGAEPSYAPSHKLSKYRPTHMAWVMRPGYRWR